MPRLRSVAAGILVIACAVGASLAAGLELRGAVAAAGQTPAGEPVQIVQVPLLDDARPGNAVNGYVVVRGDQVMIVDTGYPNNAHRIGEAISSFGLDWPNVRHLVLTHSHSDHTGSVEGVLALAPGIEVSAGALDLPQLIFSRAVQPLFDGDEILGLRVVDTPGHTLGHISLYDAPGAVLIVGSAAGSQGSSVVVPRADDQFPPASLEAAHASIRRLAELTFDRALFNHTGPIETGGAAAFREAAASLP